MAGRREIPRVPVSNFFGWFLTAYFYYQAFALYCRANPIPALENAPSRQGLWLPSILFYAVCGLGNALILKLPMAPPVVTDAAGKRWLTADILNNCVLVSLLMMVPLALLAWLKARAIGGSPHSLAPDRYLPAPLQ
jgi:hypothetical protein